MPVDQDGPFEIRIRSDEHNPPHTHVFESGEEVVVVSFLDPYLSPMYGTSYPSGSKSRIKDLIRENLEELLNEWERCNPNLRS